MAVQAFRDGTSGFLATGGRLSLKISMAWATVIHTLEYVENMKRER